MNDAGAEVNVSTPLPQAQNAEVQQAPQPQPQQLQLQPYLMVILPFAVLALVLIIRALPWSKRTLERKPLSCQACMSVWVSLMLAFGLSWMSDAHWAWVLLHVLSTPGASMLLLAIHTKLTAPTELPLPPFGKVETNKRAKRT